MGSPSGSRTGGSGVSGSGASSGGSSGYMGGASGTSALGTELVLGSSTCSRESLISIQGSQGRLGNHAEGRPPTAAEIDAAAQLAELYADLIGKP